MRVIWGRKWCWTELPFILQEGLGLKGQGKNMTTQDLYFFPFQNLTFLEESTFL